MHTWLALWLAAAGLPAPCAPHAALCPSAGTVQQSSAPAAVRPDESSQPPAAVHLDVIALDSRGRVPEGLKPSDFEVAEDGIRQTIDDVQLIRPDAGGGAGSARVIESLADERAEGARRDVRMFAIFLDEYHVDESQTPRVREAIRRFIDETLSPQDLIVVMRPLDSLLKIRMTRGLDEAGRLVDQFVGRKGDYTPRTDYERDYFAGTPARIDQLRNQVTTSALNALALHLGSLNRETRKTLIVVSEGLPRVEHRRGLEPLPTFDSVIRAANRSNVAVYAVDPREAIANGVGVIPGDALQAIVAATGGRSVNAAPELAAAMRSIRTDSSAYYLLTYRSGQQASAGFHQVRVNLKKPGVTLRARDGYWTAPADDGLRAAMARTAAPAATGPPRHISPLIQPWFGISRGAGGKTRVTFVWEPAIRVPGDRTRQAQASRVVIKAVGPNGAPIFEQAVKPTGALRTEGPGDEAIRAVFDVAPGSVRLQMSIEDVAAQAIDSDVRDITVRDLSARVALGTPEVLRARTARDFRAIENDPAATPVVSREFSRTEHLIVRFPVYAPSGAAVQIATKLLSRSGQTMQTIQPHDGPGDPPVNQIDFPLAGFAVGEYYLEISATSEAGSASERFPFRVTN
jgi:VWFA-related protein